MRNERREGPLDFDFSKFNYTKFYESHYNDALKKEQRRRAQRKKHAFDLSMLNDLDNTNNSIVIGACMLVSFIVAFASMR